MHIVLAVEELNQMYGGVERTVVKLANYLVGAGYRTTILTFEQKGDGEPAYEIDSGVERHHLGLVSHREYESRRTDRLRLKARFPSPVTSVIRNLLACKRILTARSNEIPVITRAFSSLKPDVVISFKTHFHRYVVPAANRMGIPVIASEHSPPEQLYYRYLCATDRRVVWNCLRRANAIRLLIGAFRDGYPADLQSRTTVIPNGIDLPDRVASAENSSNDPFIINVGRLSFEKDQGTLIEAFARVSNDFPDWRVRIYGDGEREPFLRHTITRLGLENRVLLMGPEKNIIPAYQAARIFALPSLFEGFGNVTLEALACGLPVVAFDNCAATRELIQNEENGLLVPDQDRVGAMAGGLERLLRDADLRVQLGTKARLSARRFETGAVMQQWENLITHQGTTARTTKHWQG